MAKDEDFLRELVNSTGFLFQIRVEDEIRKTQDNHGWEVIDHEHPWKNQETGEGGYIDLVLGSGRQRMVVECKRKKNKDATWVFLVPSEQKMKMRLAQIRWMACFAGAEQDAGAWDEVSIFPETPESEYCEIREKGEPDRSTLEKLVGNLIESVDALAIEEQQIHRRTGWFNSPKFYLPVILTTASLVVCRFDPKEVSLEDGTLAGGRFEAVSTVRFRKALTTMLAADAKPQSLEKSKLGRERTVFVLHAAALPDILKGWSLLPAHGRFDPFPWDIAQNLAMQRKPPL